MPCKFLGKVHTRSDAHEDIFRCGGGFDFCTLESSALTKHGKPIASCILADGDACPKFVELELPKPPQSAPTRLKANFCYFTGTNRTNEKQIIETMIASARRSGVPEDIHVFSPVDIDGAVNYRIEATRSWKNHFTKIDLLKELHDIVPQYDYYVWLDTDTFFVRDPGTLKELIRDNKTWIAMESQLTDPNNKHHGWQYIERNHLVRWMQELGCGPEAYGTNGGLWIVRSDAVDEFHHKGFELRAEIDRRAGRNIDDEVVLSILGQIMVPDPQNNQFETYKHIWVCDWNSQWSDAKGKLPDGSDWHQWDWLTGADMGMVNPAIIHAMRSKQLMGGSGWKWLGHAPQSDSEVGYLTCPHRRSPTGVMLNCSCSVDKAIYECSKHGKCLKKLPTGSNREKYGNQLNGVTICDGCDGWKSP